MVLGFEAADPGRYGRLVHRRGLERIVEYKDADEAIRAIRLVNSGVVAADAAVLREFLPRIGNRNAAGEYYPDRPAGLAELPELRVDVVTCDEDETLGINTRAELAAAEALFKTAPVPARWRTASRSAIRRRSGSRWIPWSGAMPLSGRTWSLVPA